jgi:hypothetical protein
MSTFASLVLQVVGHFRRPQQRVEGTMTSPAFIRPK